MTYGMSGGLIPTRFGLQRAAEKLELGRSQREAIPAGVREAAGTNDWRERLRVAHASLSARRECAPADSGRRPEEVWRNWFLRAYRKL
jgi:hypothetical protein